MPFSFSTLAPMKPGDVTTDNVSISWSPVPATSTQVSTTETSESSTMISTEITEFAAASSSDVTSAPTWLTFSCCILLLLLVILNEADVWGRRAAMKRQIAVAIRQITDLYGLLDSASEERRRLIDVERQEWADAAEIRERSVTAIEGCRSALEESSAGHYHLHQLERDVQKILEAQEAEREERRREKEEKRNFQVRVTKYLQYTKYRSKIVFALF